MSARHPVGERARAKRLGDVQRGVGTLHFAEHPHQVAAHLLEDRADAIREDVAKGAAAGGRAQPLVGDVPKRIRQGGDEAGIGTDRRNPPADLRVPINRRRDRTGLPADEILRADIRQIFGRRFQHLVPESVLGREVEHLLAAELLLLTSARHRGKSMDRVHERHDDVGRSGLQDRFDEVERAGEGLAGIGRDELQKLAQRRLERLRISGFRHLEARRAEAALEHIPHALAQHHDVRGHRGDAGWILHVERDPERRTGVQVRSREVALFAEGDPLPDPRTSRLRQHLRRSSRELGIERVEEIAAAGVDRHHAWLARHLNQKPLGDDLDGDHP